MVDFFLKKGKKGGLTKKMLTEKILATIFAETESMLWSLARNTKIPGYDPEDLIQEMKIKIWKVIESNKYDPERCKETSFFYRVCKRHLLDVNKAKIFRYSAGNRVYRDSLDQQTSEIIEGRDEALDLDTDFINNFSESFREDYLR